MTKSKSNRSRTLSLAIGTALAAAGVVHNATAEGSIFKAEVLDGGGKAEEEGKCGEGKCGGDKAAEEGKCGEGKCGGTA